MGCVEDKVQNKYPLNILQNQKDNAFMFLLTMLYE